MTRTQIASTSIFAVLLLAGCQANTPQPVPAKFPATPTSQSLPPASDLVKQEDEDQKKEMAAKKRKSKAYDLDKTNAYKNYVP